MFVEIKPARNFRVERVNELSRRFEVANLYIEDGFLVITSADSGSALAVYGPLCWEAVIFGDDDE